MLCSCLGCSDQGTLRLQLFVSLHIIIGCTINFNGFIKGINCYLYKKYYDKYIFNRPKSCIYGSEHEV